ncbi:hypothetical protein KZZ52_46855 [Dactylosporangium sp. AC04546]|uniref:hypothetical protein n=1 Tax=Dactylosporangium sp. AC04546 TaxID=2862460 RepID=UPI001EE151A4|nr:hypothetical protein [Dactylosporangium sp. AC04546]WVK81434.1 hypothetical protein KZZ52_46855 [Dactylosporangium sp. AC04546]
MPENSKVDVEQIEKLPPLLDTLQRYVETDCIGYMTNIKAHLDVSGVDMDDVDVELNAQATPFGGFYSAYGVQSKASSAYKAVNETLHNLAKAIGELIEPTKKIAQNYRTTEEQNQASMADIKKLLEDGAGTYKVTDQDAVDNTNDPVATAQEPHKKDDDVQILAPGPLDGSGSGQPKTTVV